jgi:hypothetical protein
MTALPRAGGWNEKEKERRVYLRASSVADNGSVNGDEAYEGVICLACKQVHVVNPKTGKVLGADEETN